MTDQSNFQQAQAGQPVKPSSQEPVAQPAPVSTENLAGNQTEFVTKEQAMQLAREAVEQANREKQSKFDKTKAEIAKEVKRLAQVGVTATQEQVQAILEAKQVEESSAQAISVQQAAQPSTEVVADPVIRKSLKIMGEVGLTNDQEEFKLIDQVTDDPEVFLASVHKAAEAYAERNTNLSNPARVPSLSSGSTSSTPSHAGKSATATLDDYYSNLKLN